MKSRAKSTIFLSISILLISLVLAGGVLAAPRFQATFTVTNTDDDGPGSLRAAMLAANSTAGLDVIQVQVDGAVSLASPLPVVTDDLAIDGSGYQFIIDGSSRYRIFEIPAGVSLEITALELDSGYGEAAGGAVLNEGAFTAHGCIFLANFADLGGGAIYNLGTAQLAAGTQVSQGNADQGAGIYNLGELYLEDVDFNGNVAVSGGGAVYNTGALTIVQATFEGNLAYQGAGLYSQGGSLNVSNSSFTGNSADVEGGAVYAAGGFAITGSVFTANHAPRGGAMYLAGSAAGQVAAAEFRQNTAEDGGAILNAGGLEVADSLLEANQAQDTGGAVSNAGTLALRTVSLIGNTAATQGGALDNLASGSVVMEVVTLQGNQTNVSAGALYNAGTVNGTQTAFVANQSDWGGAVNNTGTLSLQDSRLDDNDTGAEGGALYNTGTLSLGNTTLTGNRGSDGGALYNRGEATVTGGSFTNNGANLDFGGAIYNQHGILRLTDTDFSRNFVQNGGGAIFSSGELQITGGVFTRNNAKWGGAIHNWSDIPAVFSSVTFEDNGSGHWGGAILNDGTLEVLDCAFTGNRGEEFSGALHNNRTLLVRGSTFDENTAPNGKGGALYNGGQATIEDSSFTRSQAEDGGALYNTRTLRLAAVTLSENRTTHHGGGVYNTGSLEANDSQFLSNGGSDPVTFEGGGIYNAQGASATLANSLFEGNFAWYNGGAVSSYGPLSVSLSRFTHNSALDMGGAIFQIGDQTTIQDTAFISHDTWNYAGTLYLNSDTLIQRSLIRDSYSWTGGAILSGGTLRIENSTLSNNIGDYEGAAIQNYGTTSILFSTLADNSAASNPQYGAAVQNFGTLTFTGSIIAGTDTGANCIGLAPQAASNLSDDDSCAGFTVANPLLGPLQDNGGPTFTHALLWGSPAIDAGGTACPPDDQRGQPRPQGLACDLGAYEAAQSLLDIDIRPNSSTNVINLDSPGTVPVAVLSSPGFYAPGVIDPTSLRFGVTGWENPPLVSAASGKLLCNAIDANGDGLKDLVCTFALAGTNFTCQSQAGLLRGLGRDGAWLVGTDTLQPRPCP